MRSENPYQKKQQKKKAAIFINSQFPIQGFAGDWLFPKTMCDCLSWSLISLSHSKPQTLTRIPKFPLPSRLKLPANAAGVSALFPSLCCGKSEPRESQGSSLYSLGSENHGFPTELGFEEGEGGDGEGRSGRRGRRYAGEEASPEFLEPKGGKRQFEEEDLVRFEGGNGGEEESLVRDDEKTRMGKGKQVMRRSGLLAKQVISIRSALSLGFVSQLWVDTTSVSMV